MIPLDSTGGPLYGLSMNVARPPLAAVLSVLMVIGVDWIGLLVLRALRLADFERWPWLRWQGPVVGAALTAALLYPLALAGGFPRSFVRFLAAGLVMIGSAHAWRWTGSWRPRSHGPRGITDVSFWLTVAGLGLLAFGPVTEADSLDYHLGVAITILNTGTFPFSPEWFSSRLAGSGEVLIALGVSIGAEQFGSLLQYSGFLAVVGILKYGPTAVPVQEPEPQRWRRIIALAAVSSPVFLAWVASPKPMLLPVAMTTAALAVMATTLWSDQEGTTPLQLRNAFALVCLLVMVAAGMKMNFLMSGAIVGLLAFGRMLRCRKLRSALIIGGVATLLIMVPPVAWKQQHYGGALIDALLTPFPGNWPGTREFEAFLRAYRDTQVPFPFSLVIPSGLGTVTTVLGLGMLLPLFSVARVRSYDPGFVSFVLFVLAAAVVATLGAILGQRNARFFLEPYLWMLIATGFLRAPRCERTMRWISGAVTVQAMLVLSMIGIGVAMVTPGALTSELRENTMDRHANGHAMMKWANKVLPADARVVVEPRSIALAPRFAIADDWRSYVCSGSSGAQQYLDAVNRQQPEFVLVQVAVGERPPSVPECNDEVYAGPFRTREATRNPFNWGAESEAWIIRRHVSGVPQCPASRYACPTVKAVQ